METEPPVLPSSHLPHSSKERLFLFGMLALILGAFFSFGWFHLGKFETTDEHLWKYDRIGQYWSALAEWDLEKTYINDKPGVTVALISGFGLLAEPHPEQNELRPENDSRFEAYDAKQSEITNVHFRLPVLIFSTFALIGFFFLLGHTFGNWRIALLGTLMIALSPVLVGIAQIINPDSFFWIFGSLSALAYFALLRTGRFSFVILTGILTGFALLSKYTAFILFAFYGLALCFSLIGERAADTDWRNLGTNLVHLALIFLLSVVVFALFLPAVFVRPEYLFKGISQFFSGDVAPLPTLFFAGLLILAGTFIIRRFPLTPILKFFRTKERFISGVILAAFLALFFLSLLNVWTGQKLVPVDALRDAAYSNEPQSFNFRPLIPKGAPELGKNARLIFVESYPLFFALSPLILGLILMGCMQFFRGKLSSETRLFLVTLIAFTLLYFASTLFAKVVTNARYLILLYPLFAIGAALVLFDLLRERTMKQPLALIGAAFFVFAIGSLTLWQVRPFYFSYTNSLLPNQFTAHDSWGHGAYEAAQYLNSLPNAQNIIIWSNSDTVCRFFEGKCLRSRKIDLSVVTPDYFVLSKRGVIKLNNRFILLNNPDPEKDSDYYFKQLEKDPLWKLEINGRPENYLKIIPFEK
jgi:4-amino-4-deoxy-L-arabinose transferase-like glycosyltransferase